MIRAGVAGERDAAYEIEFHFGEQEPDDDPRPADRVRRSGRPDRPPDHQPAARHLGLREQALRRGRRDQRAWRVGCLLGHRPQGIPSPVEQNRRHIAVLADVFSKGLVPLPKRLGLTIKPQMNSLVLVSNGARISRPRGRAAASVEGLETVIKVDQLWPTLERAWDQHGVAVFGKVVSQETVETLARRLAALHVPASVDWAARFGLSPEPRRGIRSRAHPRPRGRNQPRSGDRRPGSNMSVPPAVGTSRMP